MLLFVSDYRSLSPFSDVDLPLKYTCTSFDCSTRRHTFEISRASRTSDIRFGANVLQLQRVESYPLVGILRVRREQWNTMVGTLKSYTSLSPHTHTQWVEYREGFIRLYIQLFPWAAATNIQICFDCFVKNLEM